MGRRGFTGSLASRHGLPVDRYPMTKEEIAIAEDALAADLAKLSMVEREKILFDIHGLPTTTTLLGAGGDGTDDDHDEDCCVVVDDDEEPKDTASRVVYLQEERKLLKSLEDELRKIVEDDRKSAYERALYLNPDYVRGREFQLGFLQCAENDPVEAAEQIVQHFATKRKLFGSAGDILARPILYSDLPPGAVKWLESGCCQILPSRDAGGRVVMFIAAGHSAHHENLEDTMRAVWYFEQIVATCDDESSVSRDGIIMIEYIMGSYGAVLDVNDIEQLVNNCIDGSSMKVGALHVCFDDPSLESYVAGATLFTGEADRHRIRTHFGSTTADVLFRLQTFGIPTHEFPINDKEDTLEVTRHREWLACQRQRETLGSGSAKSSSILAPRRFDVLFGRAEGTRDHTGNLRAAHLVQMHFQEYEEASRRQKTVIATQVVSKILESYGRFLKWKEGAGWVEVDFDTARDKVSHFFRRRRFLVEEEKRNLAKKRANKKTNRPPVDDDQSPCSVLNNKRLR